eukprot:gene2496-3088_t
MGNTQTKERIDLTPRTLALTSGSSSSSSQNPQQSTTTNTSNPSNSSQRNSTSNVPVQPVVSSSKPPSSPASHTSKPRPTNRPTSTSSSSSGTTTTPTSPPTPSPSKPPPSIIKKAPATSSTSTTTTTTTTTTRGGVSNNSIVGTTTTTNQSTTTTTTTTTSRNTPSSSSSSPSPSSTTNNNSNVQSTTSTSTTTTTTINNTTNNNSQTISNSSKQSLEFIEEYKNRSTIPVYLIPEDPFKTHQKTLSFILEDLYSQSNVNTAYYSTLLQKRLSILKRIHLALKREIARKKLFDSVYHSKAKTRTKKVHIPPISIRIACRLFITTLQEQVFEQKISLPTLRSFNSMIRDLPALSMAGEPQDCIDSLTKWLLSAISTNISNIKRESMESLIGLALSQGSLSSILFALSLIILPEKQQQLVNNSQPKISNVISKLNVQQQSQTPSSQTQNNTTTSNTATTTTTSSNNNSSYPNTGTMGEIGLRMIPFIRQLEQWKVDLPLSPLTRDLLFSTWPISWNDNASDDSLSFLSSPNPNIATITSDGEYIYIHDTCGLAKIGTGYFGTHQGRIYARLSDWFPKEKGWIVSIGNFLYYRSPSTEPATLIVLDPMNLQEIGRIYQDGSGSFPTVNNLTLPFGPENDQSRGSSTDDSFNNITNNNSLFPTPQSTTRSPIFTDGRYLYLLSLQRFHNFGNKQFIVDMYDPFKEFQHYRRIELRYPDSDFNEESVLNPAILELGSFYTNGHYLMVVIPPPLGTDYNYDTKSFICRAFSLSDGTLIGNYCLENQPIGLASFYDYLNNVIWNYSSSESEIGKYGNEGFGPKHNFPTIITKHHHQQSQSNNNNDKTNIAKVTSTSFTTSMVESDDNVPMEPKQVVSTILGILSRLAVDYMPSTSENSGIHHVYKLNEPYSVEVNYNTFSQLYSILKHYQSQLKIGFSSSQKIIDTLRCIIYCLRLLKVNLFRLSTNIRSLERNQQLYQDNLRDGLLKCIDQNFLHLLRDLLTSFVIDGVESFSNSGSNNSNNNNSSENILEFQTIREESCEVLTIGLDLFYPSSLDKANFVFKLLEQVYKYRKEELMSSTSNNSTTKKPPSKLNSKDQGYSMLLNTVLALLSSHPNASFFALPPLPSEMPSPFSLLNFEGDNNNSQRPFDPMNLFVPIITHLLAEAQATIPPQTIIPHISRQDSTQHLGFSLYSSAPPPPLSSSSPAMRLLLAIQKDLILRVENSVVGTDAPSQALVAYSRLLMDKCKELLLGVLDADPSQKNQSILLTDFKSSVVGALLPTLIHSLFLFSYHIWLAKELLPSLVQLIGVVDRVNRRLPKLLNRPELGRQPLQKRSSFVEGPSRISESPHPYHPHMNSRQLVTIPGAVFLSLVFDERSSTSSSEDHLFIYESYDSKEPLDQFTQSHWPKRRILIPGDTVIFQFITGSVNTTTNPYNNYWGYRCNIIGHMPNSDKTSLPWSSHLEKTMCCLAGRFSSCLISGDSLTDLELENSRYLESPLFLGGVEEEYVSHVLFSSNNASENFPHPNPQPQPFIPPFDPNTTQSCMSPNIVTTNINNNWRSIQRFCFSLAKRNGEIFSSNLSDFMWKYITGERIKGRGTIRAAQQSIIASLIKHLGLGEVALNFSLELLQSRENQLLSTSNEPSPNPPQSLVDVWRSVLQVRTAIIQKHQENQFTNNIGDDDTAKRRSVDFKTHSTLRETIYKDITDSIIEKAMFTLELQSYFDQQHDHPVTNPSISTEISNTLIKFVLSNVQLDDVKKILISRRSRAYTRTLGLQAMKDILRCASDHTMKHEVLCFIGPALRNSGLVKRRCPPYHYLDYLHGCGSRLLKEVKRGFRLLMDDVSALLSDPNSDSTLKLYALDSFTLNFTLEDSELLTSVDIFNKIHNLMTNDSIWGGMWSYSGNSSNQLLGGTSPTGSMLHATSSSNSLIDGDSPISLGTMIFGPNASTNTSSQQTANTSNNPLNSSTGMSSSFITSSVAANSFYSNFVEEEKLEREKLKKNAKALFKFLGLICVSETTSSMTTTSSSVNGTSSPPTTSGNSNSGKYDVLRDSFFNLMATQLESSLIFLKEQNKTYWSGSDLFNKIETPTTSSLLSSPSNNIRGRRIYRGEKSYYNYDFSDGLTLLYILSAFNSVKQRLCSPVFINIFHCILQVGDETQRKLTLRIFRRILPYSHPSKLLIPTTSNNNNSSSPSSPMSSQQQQQQQETIFSLLLNIVGAVSYWGCSSDLLEISKHIDPRFFISSSNYNLFFSSNYNTSTKLDSPHSFFSIFDKSSQLPSCFDTRSCNPTIRFSNDSKIATFTSFEAGTQIIRSNNIIPESIPLFYFEIKIENEPRDNVCIVGLFPSANIDQLKTLKDWRFGYGYSGKDGHKVCNRITSTYRSRPFASTFTRNDVIGCGWNRKDGRVFFTKNGKYLGTAFKNVFGDYYPVAAMTSGGSLSVNFGQTPFQYDLTPLTSYHLETLSEKTLPSMALSYVSELVSLLRARVEVDIGSGCFEKGTIIEYSPQSHLSRVLLDSNIEKLIKTTHHRRSLKPIYEVSIDFSQLLNLPSIQTSISNFLKSPRILIGNTVSGGSVEFALGRPIQFLEEPKVEKMEQLSFLLKERIYDRTFKSFVNFDSSHQQQLISSSSSQQHQQQQNNTKDHHHHSRDHHHHGSRDHSRDHLSLRDHKNSTSSHHDDYSIDDQLMTEIEFEDDNELEDLQDFDDILEEEMDEDEIGVEGEDQKSNSAKLRQNSNPTNVEDEEADEEDNNNNNGGEDDIIEEGITGKRVPWMDIKVGTPVMISKREKLGLRKSNWVYEMDGIIGTVGIVKSIDKKHKQTLVTFLDDETLTLIDWWVCYEVFIVPTEKSNKNPLQSIEKFSHSQLVHLDTSAEMALSILYSRQALISLLVSLPQNSKISYSSFGGAKNLIYILKLTLHTSLLNDSSNYSVSNTNITKLLNISSRNQKDFQNLKSLQSKLSTLLKYESISNQFNIDSNSGSQAEGTNSLNSSSNSLSSTSSTGGGSNNAINNLNTSSGNLMSASSNNVSTTTKWKSYKPEGHNPLTNSNSSNQSNNNNITLSLSNSNTNLSTTTIGQSSFLGEPLKTGILMKQQKIIKLWKRMWVVLSGDTLFYYKFSSNSASTNNNNTQQIKQDKEKVDSNTPIGSIDLRDIVSVTQVSLLKQAKIFSKKDFCFQITVASNKTHLFQAQSLEDLNDWIQIINSACISSASFRSKTPTSSSTSLLEVLTKECCQQLKDTSHEVLPTLIEESPHPHPPYFKFKKVIRIEGAQSVLVQFDPKSYTEPGYGVLKFFYDPCCTHHIASFSGKLSSFPPTLIHSGQFWMVFTSDSQNTEWGYKFSVTPVRMTTSDVSLLPQPSFEFACFIVDWILQLDIQLFKQYPNFFSHDLVEMLLIHVEGNKPLDRKLKAINFLTRLLLKLRESGSKDFVSISGKLESLKEEMFKIHKIESTYSTSSSSSSSSSSSQSSSLSTSQSPFLSQYLQKLIELCIQTQFFDSASGSNIAHQNNTSVENTSSNSLFSLGSQINNPYINPNIINSSNNLNNSSTMVNNSCNNEGKLWFTKVSKTSKILEHLFKGKGFSKEFIKESFVETRFKQVIDSPHPYPHGARVTANIVVPNAISLKVEFDPKSKTQIYVDYLMFSKLTPGGDDLGFFTGEFPTQPIIIQGDRFIWSFYSDSNESEWGFRFTITPQFSDEIIKENDRQFDSEIEYLFAPSTRPWTHSMDLELVKFVNTMCEKQKKTSSQLIFDQCFIPEFLTLFPLLVEVDLKILFLRFIILKHFNSSIQSFIPYVDLKSASDDWSIPYQLCSLRGLLFYDMKLEIFGNSLHQTKSFGRRPLINLNRHGSFYGGSSASSSTASTNNSNKNQIKNEYLFIQTFKQLSAIDPSRLKHNDRAWEVKLEREGARDAGGPYRECITQICTEFQSREMNLFLPCHNAQGDVAFNRDKLVPNSSENSPYSLQLFEFIGKLIGIAIRTRNCIELSFPSIIWKSLVCTKVDRVDLEAIDKYCTNLLELLEGKDSLLSMETFDDCIFENFVAKSIDNSLVELVPEGKNIKVSWDNRLEYGSALEHYKLTEYKLQIDSMVKGVASILPLHLLNIFTWQEIELRVCGMPGVDIKLLKKHTRYCGLSISEPRVVWFWKILESFSSEEQTLFLRFVWGRSRLPPSNEFNSQFQLQIFIKNDTRFYDEDYETGSRYIDEKDQENQDAFLPEAQTCFFSLSLPNYSSPEIMREKLLYAITTCREIDADFIIPDENTSSTSHLIENI